MTQGNINYQWALTFIHALVHAGVRHFVAAPGSRSTPLVLAALSHPQIALHMHVDERTAAFFALGAARATGEPAAVIATSGSAAAHFHPAAIEASMAGIPLLLLTADRPIEDQNKGTMQTIDQTKLFGDTARAFFAAPHIADTPHALRQASALAVRATVTSRHPLPGPVHINLPFAQPLEPDAPTLAAAADAIADAPWQPRVALPRQTPLSDDLQYAAHALDAQPQGWIVCGPNWDFAADSPSLDSLRSLATTMDYPVFTEVTSGLITPHDDADIYTEGLDFVSRVALANDAFAPTCILELGGSLTSGAYQRFVAAHPNICRIVLSPHQLRDPHDTAHALLLGDLAHAVDQLAKRCAPRRRTTPSWRDHMHKAVALWRRSTEAALRSPHFHEGHICRAVSQSLRPDIALCIGNSLALRDLDLFAHFTNAPHRVLHQRGASGIDGLISSAAGAHSALARPTIALIGDRSALHDVGGLAALPQSGPPLIIALIQNHGGRIIEQLTLAQSAVPQTWQRDAFVIPQGPAWAHLARAFSLPYLCAQSETELAQALAQRLEQPGAAIIEAIVTHPDSRPWRTSLYAQAAALTP